MDLDGCLQTNEGCDAFKKGACNIDGNYRIRHITSTDKADCQVMLFSNLKQLFEQQNLCAKIILVQL